MGDVFDVKYLGLAPRAQRKETSTAKALLVHNLKAYMRESESTENAPVEMIGATIEIEIEIAQEGTSFIK